MLKTKNDSLLEYDLCVLCGKMSEYTKETPIDQRVGYIEGAGQLCLECYQFVYLKDKVIHG